MSATAPSVGWQYGDVSVREDLTDMIFQITPTDTPVMNITSRGTANAILHEWQTRNLTTRQDNAVAEGAVYVFDEPIRRTARETNFTQNFLNVIRVTSSMEASEQAGIASMFAEQAEIQSIEFKTDMEHAIINGTVATGTTGGTARRMIGLVQAITTGITTYTNGSGTQTLTETAFNDFIQACWDEGGAPRDWFAGGSLKRTISGFTASSTSYRDQASGRVVNTISVYESDFFVIETHLSRDVLANAGTTHSILGLDRTMLSMALLRPVTMERTAKIASSTDGVIEAEGCITWGNRVAHFYAENYLSGV